MSSNAGHLGGGINITRPLRPARGRHQGRTNERECECPLSFFHVNRSPEDEQFMLVSTPSMATHPPSTYPSSARSQTRAREHCTPPRNPAAPPIPNHAYKRRSQ